MSYRFLRDKKSWRVFVSTEGVPVKRITSKHRGAIGIDINSDQLALAELDRSGNFIGGGPISSLTYGKTRNQAKAIVSDAVQRVIEAAVETRKPVVIERLEFAKKKAALENESRKRARNALELRVSADHSAPEGSGVSLAGVRVIEVNPAYTPTIGR